MAKAKARPASISIDAPVMRSLEKHAYSILDAEVGGMLFGRIEGGKTVIVGAVPASKAAADQISLTFTHEVWDDILKKGQKFYPDMQIVGWYHTHPNFGLFLSEYDAFIQENFFQNAGQIALVIDPIAGNMGWFNLNKSGHVQQIGEEKTLTGPKAAPAKASVKQVAQATASSPKPIVLAVAATMVVAGAAGFVTSSLIDSQKYTALNKAYEQSQQETANTFAQLEYNFGVNYQVQDGDTLRSITDMFWGAKAPTTNITDVNIAFKDKEVKPGDRLQILHPTTIVLNPNIQVPEPEPTETPTPTPTPTK